MKRLIFLLSFIALTASSFAQFTDTAQYFGYVRDTIKDRRPDKVTAAQIQKALLGVSHFLVSAVTPGKGLKLYSDGSIGIKDTSNAQPLSYYYTDSTANQYLNVQFDAQNGASFINGYITGNPVQSFLSTTVSSNTMETYLANDSGTYYDFYTDGGQATMQAANGGTGQIIQFKLSTSDASLTLNGSGVNAFHIGNGSTDFFAVLGSGAINVNVPTITDATGLNILVADGTNNVKFIAASALGDIYQDYHATDVSSLGDAPGSYITRLLRMRDTTQGDIKITDSMYYSGKDPLGGDNLGSVVSRSYSTVSMNFADTITGSAPGNYKYASSAFITNIQGTEMFASQTYPDSTTTYNSTFYLYPSQVTAEMFFDSTYAGIHFEAGTGGEFMRLSLLTKNGQVDQTTTQIELLRDSLLLQSQFIDIHGTLRFNSQQPAPTSSSDTSGTPGEMRVTPTGELYVKTGTGWLKFTGATF